MKGVPTSAKIESSFRKQVQKDKKLRNAYLLVQSDKLDINLQVAEGRNGNIQANIKQPNHLASVGKLFTATLISILYENNKLDFDDAISKYLDAELMEGLHIYKGKDHSEKITIRHLLKQTSGLNDVFYHLWNRMLEDPGFKTTPREAVLWGKAHLNPVAVPGKRHFYTDTNYYLLGLIIENITSKKFHEVMHELIFEPLKMKHAYMHGFSKPEVESSYPTASLYFEDVDLLSVEGVHQIDYAGGSVVAPLDEFLVFMRSLENQKLIKSETLSRMVNDDVNKGFPAIGFKYGYAVWKMMPIPLIIPKKFYSWGCVGVTGAFMFYHPVTTSYIAGTFNDSSYKGKALQFMIRKVIKELLSSQ